MLKIILPCATLVLSALVLSSLAVSISSAAADEAAPASGERRLVFSTDGACLDAVSYLARSDYERSDKPLSALGLALIRSCNGHPKKIICEATSQAVMREFGKTPFTCGSNILDDPPLLLPPDNPAQPR
jgi:hypothetical protein